MALLRSPDLEQRQEALQPCSLQEELVEADPSFPPTCSPILHLTNSGDLEQHSVTPTDCHPTHLPPPQAAPSSLTILTYFSAGICTPTHALLHVSINPYCLQKLLLQVAVPYDSSLMLAHLWGGLLLFCHQGSAGSW